MSDEISKEITKEILFNRQVNYMIIEKLWEYNNRDKMKDEFYKLIGIDKNTYTRIRTASEYDYVDLEKRWNIKHSPLHKIGLSREIMVGLKLIKTDGISINDWKEYIKYRYENKKSNPERSKAMQSLNKKLKELFQGLNDLKINRQTTSDIGKLYYFTVYGRAVTLDVPDAEMIDLRDSLKNVTVEKMQVCDKKLRNEIYEALKERYEQLDVLIKYERLIK